MDPAAEKRVRLGALKAQVEARLCELAPAGGRLLPAAMHHAVTTPGKRLRPLLLLLTAIQLGRPVEDAMDAACAVEMVHAASLVIDDLPCMDDSPLRRGHPATHVRYGQDVAVLAGVALLNQAYALLSRAPLCAAVRLDMVEALSHAVGLEGLAAGQDLDLHEPSSDLSGLRQAHHLKTGALFVAAVGLGGRIGGASGVETGALERFGAELGLAFQARDDVLDARETHGGPGSGRSTLISLLGPEGARREAQGRLSAAKRALTSGGPRLEPLCAYVDLLLGERDRVAETMS